MANEKRLIDANAFAGCLERMTKTAYPNLFPGLLEAIDYVKDFPTVDAVEVVHGRWLPDMEEFDDDPAVGIRGGVFQTGWKCSICGRTEQTKEPYCNCGAKMDGDGNG